MFLPNFILIFSVLAKRLAGKSFSDMTYLVLSEPLNLNSVNPCEKPVPVIPKV